LISNEVLSVADVFIVEWTTHDIEKMKNDIIKKLKQNIREFTILDPKSIYKEAKLKGNIETLVSYE
jgi:hypothetical protein